MATNLIAAIKEKQSLIAKLQAELDEARALLAHGGSSPVSGRLNHSPRVQRKSGRAPKRTPALPYKPSSSVGKAAKALRDEGKPLHIDDLVSRIRGKVKKATLVGNLSRYVKEGKVFARTAPGTFGLLGWEKDEEGKPKRTPVRAEDVPA